MSLSDYQSFKGLPPLAGVCSIEEAAKPGLSVEEVVRRLKRYHYAFKRLHEIFTARITAEPIYELKTAFSHHAVPVRRARRGAARASGEMREPPLGLEVVPDTDLEMFFDEILAAPTTEELLVGVYEKALPALREALQRHMARHQPAGRCTVGPRVPVRAASKIDDMLAFGAAGDRAAWCDEPPAMRRVAGTLLDEALAAAGGLDGTVEARPANSSSGSTRKTRTSTTPSPSATSASPTRTTRASTPRRSSTTRTCRRQREDADDALQAAARDRRAGDDGEHHPPRPRASRGSTTATCRASSGTRPGTR